MSRSLNRITIPNPLNNRTNSLKPRFDNRPNLRFQFRELGCGPDELHEVDAPDELTAVQCLVNSMRMRTPYPDRTVILFRPKCSDGKWVVTDHSSPRFVGCK